MLLGTEDTLVNRTGKFPAPMELKLQGGEETKSCQQGNK